MKSIFKFGLLVSLVYLAACAGPQRGGRPGQPGAESGKPQPVEASLSVPKQMILFIPQTDQGATNWLKLFDKFPGLRMTIALSPRFQRFVKEPPLKQKALELVQAGRLELALQLPNPPFLPLLINTNSAQAAVLPGTPLPNPPFVHSDDATQIVAKARADFAKTWGMTPKGLVLPHGAVNGDVLKVLNPLGLSWVLGAVGSRSIEGAYRSGSLLLWDATPIQENPRFLIQVLDERGFGNSDQSMTVLNGWAQSMAKSNITAVLPSDPELPSQELPSNLAWGNRTWILKDWTPWIGSPRKNDAWSWLRTTRDALENYKNSGQASVRRLDMAFEELYNAENANFFSGIREGEVTFNLAEDREKEFKATLSSVYRLIGQPPPENLFSADMLSALSGFKASSTTVSYEALADGKSHLVISDAERDDHGDGHLTPPAGGTAAPGRYDLRKLEVWASAESLDWVVTLGELRGSNLGTFQSAGPLLDIYIDLNGAPNVGTLALLPQRGAAVAPSDAWEYAISLWGSQALVYRTRGSETYDLSETVPLTFEGNRVKFTLPRDWLRGNPARWGYQALVMAYDPKSLESKPLPQMTPDMVVARRLPIFDLIDPLDIPQDVLMNAIEQEKRSEIPFIRLPAGQSGHSTH